MVVLLLLSGAGGEELVSLMSLAANSFSLNEVSVIFSCLVVSSTVRAKFFFFFSASFSCIFCVLSVT